jgi:hypothetical protein
VIATPQGAKKIKNKTFICLIFYFFSGSGKPRVINKWIIKHDCTERWWNDTDREKAKHPNISSQWRTEGGLRGFNPLPPEIPKF